MLGTFPDLRIQQTILVADGGEDYRRSCEASGEPLITSMSPEADPHPFDLEVSLVKSLVGPLRNRTAWEVRSWYSEMTPPYLSQFLAMATPHRKTRIAQGLFRPLERFQEQDKYWQTGRCYHFTCSGLHRLSTRVKLVSRISTRIPHRIYPHSVIRSIRPLEMRWTTLALSFQSHLSIPNLIFQ